MSTATATAAAPRLRPSLPVIVGTGLTGCAISRSLARSCRRYEVRVDTAFDEVIEACADPRREHPLLELRGLPRDP